MKHAYILQKVYRRMCAYSPFWQEYDNETETMIDEGHHV